MKRTDRLTTIIALVLFLAFAAYVAAFSLNALSDRTVTADAVDATVAVGGVASGLVVREETVLTSSETYIDVSTPNGAKVQSGQILATAMNSEAGLERAGRIHQLELEIARVTSLLSSLDSADDLTTRDENLSAAVSQLSSAVARHELSGLDEACLNIRSLLMDSGDTATDADLNKLQAELKSLRNSSTADTRELSARRSGTFSSTVDGYESLSPADLEKLSPSALQALAESPGDIPEGAYGKLVTDYRWYFAAVMSYADASNLSVGRSATLDFGRYYGAPITATVTDISGVEEGSVAVVFRCDTALEATLSMRQVSASVVFDEYDGIRVPAQAIQTDAENLSTYVWTVTAMVLERKDVEIIYCGEGFVIVRRDTGPDCLREGNTIVVTGRNLYEGKVMD